MKEGSDFSVPKGWDRSKESSSSRAQRNSDKVCESWSLYSRIERGLESARVRAGRWSQPERKSKTKSVAAALADTAGQENPRAFLLFPCSRCAKALTKMDMG